MGGRTVWNSEGKGGLSILEFPKARGGLDEDAARGRVWIYSGITHFSFRPSRLNVTPSKTKIEPDRRLTWFQRVTSESYLTSDLGSFNKRQHDFTKALIFHTSKVSLQIT